VSAWTAGRLLRRRVLQVEEERAAGGERARDAVAGERARVARELHDVIGHSISVMGIQAGAVRRVLPDELERERDTLLAVERAGRDAIADMQRLLGFLRSDGEATAEALPTLERVGDLVADLRRGGLDVELDTQGDLATLAPGTALAAFRIVQEALTNVVKHAPASRVRVAIARTPGDLEIRVANEGAAAGVAEGGRGLLGMRERVALYGGTLEAGPSPAGAFTVVAHLPIAAG
jgi:signal transduction histidine kinase